MTQEQPALPGFDADVPHGLLGRARRLVIDAGRIRYGRSGTGDEAAADWALADVAAVRYGYQSLMIYRFRVGTGYDIALRHRDGRELRLWFYTFLDDEAEEEYLWELYAEVLEALETLIKRLSAEHADLVRAGQPVRIGRVEISREGVRWEDKPTISWVDCYVQESYHSYTINSHSNSRLYATVELRRVWNAAVLLALLEEFMPANQS